MKWFFAPNINIDEVLEQLEKYQFAVNGNTSTNYEAISYYDTPDYDIYNEESSLAVTTECDEYGISTEKTHGDEIKEQQQKQRNKPLVKMLDAAVLKSNLNINYNSLATALLRQPVSFDLIVNYIDVESENIPEINGNKIAIVGLEDKSLVSRDAKTNSVIKQEIAAAHQNFEYVMNAFHYLEIKRELYPFLIDGVFEKPMQNNESKNKQNNEHNKNIDAVSSEPEEPIKDENGEPPKNLFYESGDEVYGKDYGYCKAEDYEDKPYEINDKDIPSKNDSDIDEFLVKLMTDWFQLDPNEEYDIEKEEAIKNKEDLFGKE